MTTPEHMLLLPNRIFLPAHAGIPALSFFFPFHLSGEEMVDEKETDGRDPEKGKAEASLSEDSAPKDEFLQLNFTL